MGGLCTILVHPDYDYVCYEELVKSVAEDPECWITTPSELAKWWKDRSHARIYIKEVEGAVEIESNCSDAFEIHCFAGYGPDGFAKEHVQRLPCSDYDKTSSPRVCMKNC